MFIYDSKKREKVKFEPIFEGQANIYLCGPTVYDDAHLGHAKSAVSFDLLRRTLSALGLEVKFARNYTDIDDKILNKMAQTGQSLAQITEHYIARYEADMRALNVLDPHIKPKATASLGGIISYIERLLDLGYAYTTDDGVYFDTQKDASYLSLSQKTADQNVARVKSTDQKRHERDFVLWKFDEAWYESPFGPGRPGWHTECVAMIQSNFSEGEKFCIDIHAGGLDLLFPHHENEAAQCRCAKGKELAKYWLHNGFVQINNEKMAKSLGNSFFVKDALEKVDGEVLRFYLISVHYRANFNYELEDLLAAKRRLDKLYRLKKRLFGLKSGEVCAKFKTEILNALSDDLNSSKALAALDEMIKSANEALDSGVATKADKAQMQANLDFAGEILGVGQKDAFLYFQFGVSEAQKARINEQIAKRNEAKKSRNFALADEIREQLNSEGISIMDTPNGTMWEKI